MRNVTVSAAPELSPWQYDDRHEIACEDGCGMLASLISDREALARGRQHARQTGHNVEQARTAFRTIWGSPDGSKR